MVYRAKALYALLCACETWTMYQRHATEAAKKNPNNLVSESEAPWHQAWQGLNPVTQRSLLKQAGLPSIYTILMQSQLRWAARSRSLHARPPAVKKKLCGELQQGKRNRFKGHIEGFQLLYPDTWELTA